MVEEGLRNELSRQNIFLTSIQELYNWGRRNSLWPLNFGLACCAIEMIAASMARFDIARFGAEVFRPSPRQADLMIVAGTVTKKMAPMVVRLYNQMPEPKYVIAMGTCLCTGGMFDSYAVVQGLDKVLPVDVYLPGCPPRPEALLDALLKIREKVDRESFRDADREHYEPSVPLYGNPTRLEPSREGTMIINMGPQHPATHGVLRIVLELDGETVVQAQPHVGYLHRGFEKIAEDRGYHRFIPYTDRLDYLSPLSNNTGYALAVEKLLDIEAPPLPDRGVLFEMAAQGTPVIHLLHVRGLALRYGLPWDPIPLPAPGTTAGSGQRHAARRISPPLRLVSHIPGRDLRSPRPAATGSGTERCEPALPAWSVKRRLSSRQRREKIRPANSGSPQTGTTGTAVDDPRQSSRRTNS